MKKEEKAYKETMWKLKNKPRRVLPKPSRVIKSKKNYKRIKKVDINQ